LKKSAALVLSVEMMFHMSQDGLKLLPSRDASDTTSASELGSNRPPSHAPARSRWPPEQHNAGHRTPRTRSSGALESGTASASPRVVAWGPQKRPTTGRRRGQDPHRAPQVGALCPRAGRHCRELSKSGTPRRREKVGGASKKHCRSAQVASVPAATTASSPTLNAQSPSVKGESRRRGWCVREWGAVW
jgi:hypothetical protein